MRINHSVTEITGSPARVWGNVLQATHTTTLEKKESWTRIQNIDSIEIMEAPIYPLLEEGGFLCLFGLRGLFAAGRIPVIHIAYRNCFSLDCNS